jgi:putative pyruvate formate lyase activating enzyme
MDETEMPAPSYLSLLENGELQHRAVEAEEYLSSCVLCPRECKADRLSGKTGVCQIGARARVASYGPHLGEEDPLRGRRGSGTIFFGGCNLRCQFCQNYDISQVPAGVEVEPVRLAEIMLELQSVGCHNINFVSPTHVVPQILMGLLIAAKAGLRLPLVLQHRGL